MKNLFIIIFMLIGLGFTPQVEATIETIPHLMLEETEFNIHDPGNVLWSAPLYLEHDGGKLVLSSTPDGKGRIRFGDQLKITRIPGDELTFRSADDSCRDEKYDFSPLDVTPVLKTGGNNVRLKLQHRCGGWPKTLGPLYLVYFKNTAFLRLPWDYESSGLSFSEAALRIESYFDHEYPLLSTNLTEPPEFQDSVVPHTGSQRNFNLDYSSHDGYDWASKAGAKFKEPVLAAASGVGIFVNSCAPCGNAIHIDHLNGYQTRYYHLHREDLIIDTPGEEVIVKAGQQIGRVGYTGNTIPAGEGGSHIHFMVVEDKNKDGKFDDNIPDGLTDPFGWDSDEPDPWSIYEFFYGGQQRRGNTSNYLWLNKLASHMRSFDKILPGQRVSVGGVYFTFESGISTGVNMHVKEVPSSEPSENLNRIGSVYDIIFKKWNGDVIASFTKPVTLELNFNSIDLSRVDTNTLSIYSSSDGFTWEKLDTLVDMQSGRATAQTLHFSQFGIFAEARDSTPPITEAVIDQTPDGATITLTATDNNDGSGVHHTLYKLNDSEWQAYIEPVSVTEEGRHIVSFFSEDNDGNTELEKTREFVVDRTPPEAEIYFDVDTLGIKITGTDNLGEVEVVEEEIDRKSQKVKLSDEAANTLTMVISEREAGKSARLTIDSLQYGDSEPIMLDRTRFMARYNLDKATGVLRSLDERLEIQGELRVRTDYSSLRNTTKVIVHEKGEERTVKELEGVQNLQLFTQVGSVKYRY